ncbi:phospho-sugar mutase [Christensenellaceae bacterium OttesenSCG-928-K19]|nr:phospho-sugar mutase [Christensenellaceae bacterium OttesenSCG-928-K19]
MDYKKSYEAWKNHVTETELKEELERIAGNDKKIEDRFFKDLTFGTGGLRGIIGAGDNRMNTFTVKKASQGLADYLNNHYEAPSIAIAYDSRKNSDAFAYAAAEVFAANNIHVYLYKELMPTPMLSFAVRELQCSAGVVVTASHNPAEYNGYKVYGSDGCQITLEAAHEITGFIEEIDIFEDVKNMAFDEALKAEMVQYIKQGVLDRYYEEVLKCSVYGGTAKAGLSVVYTPLNGAGNKPVRHILDKIGISSPIIVAEQEEPDADFTTCPFPNPEEKEALDLGLKLMKKENADLLLATDPDCDRVGTAVKHNGEYLLVSGNQMGVLLFDFICRMRKEQDTLPQKPFAVKTIVTTEMAQSVADSYGVELMNVLTGFKFIGEQIGLLEKANEESRYIFGFEESYGYLSGAYVRDKDAVNASMLICEMAAYYKQQSKTLIDRLQQLYKEHGYYFDKLDSTAYKGAKGMQQMNGIMEKLRQNPPNMVGGITVTSVCDYLSQTKSEGDRTEPLNLPSSDVIGLHLAGGSSIVVRPSGTEPKLKVYYSLKCKDEAESNVLFPKMKNDMDSILK